MATYATRTTRSGGGDVDDLLAGASKLGSESPEVIRLTFKALHDVIRAQGEAIKTLERAVDQRVTKAELNSLLATKASTTDLSRTVSELARGLDEKADSAELVALGERKVGKHELSSAVASSAEVVSLRAAVETKANVEELRALGLDGEQRRQQLEERLLHALEQKAGIAEVASELESKAAVADVNAMLDTKASIADVNESLLLKANKASVIAALQKKVSRSEIEVLIGADPDGGDGDGGGVRSLGTFGEQVRTLQLQQAHARAAADSANAKLGRELAAVSADVRAQLSSAQVELDELSARVRELPTASEHRRALGSRVTLDEVRALLDETARRAAVEPSGTAALVRAVHEEVSALKRALENTPTRSELHSALEAKLGAGAAAALAESATAGAAHVQLSAAVAAKADSARVDALAAELEARQAALAAELRAELSAALARAADADALSELSARIGAKADEARVASALEGKASAAELNALLAQVTSRLDSAVAAAAHSASAGPGVHSAAEQALILESLCSEHLLGRWIWKSGRTKAPHGLVPWNVQNINTNPENFGWEKDRAHIACAAGGLYEITFGFYTHRKPSVQLLVNGEPVISAINSASYAVHHSSGRLAAVGPHPAGNVSGLTLIDFLALPPRARIAIAFKGEEGAEGFLGLKKL